MQLAQPILSHINIGQGQLRFDSNQQIGLLQGLRETYQWFIKSDIPTIGGISSGCQV